MTDKAMQIWKWVVDDKVRYVELLAWHEGQATVVEVDRSDEYKAINVYSPKRGATPILIPINELQRP
jgi:hypothetical protein